MYTSNKAPFKNYSGQESKKQFEVYDYDISATLKLAQGHQTWYDMLDPKQGNNLKDLP